MHTKEPWEIHPPSADDKPHAVTQPDGECFIAHDLPISSDGMILAKVTMWTAKNGGWPRVDNEEELQANARRIVACVNACAGFPEKHLNDILKVGGFSQLATARLERQNKMLLAALKRWLPEEEVEVQLASESGQHWFEDCELVRQIEKDA